jgi:hypothetical protein
MAHGYHGAPLVIYLVVEHLKVVRHCYIAVTHHYHDAPLIVILRLGLFLAVGIDQMDLLSPSKNKGHVHLVIREIFMIFEFVIPILSWSFQWWRSI